MSKEGKFSAQPPARVTSTLTLPKGACDAHGHIFPSRDLYPTGNETMALAPVEFYLDVHTQLGFERGVLVQGGAYRFDNSAMLDALDRHPDTLRGVALVAADAGEAALAALKARNVRALRFTKGGASKIDDFGSIAPKMRALGLHAEMFIGLENVIDRAEALLAHGIPLVLDHLAGPFDPATATPAFQRLLDLMQDHDIWVKLTPARNSARYPGYEDIRPFHDALIAARPERLVWGSDWPFPNMSEETPDLGALTTLFGDWVTDEALRERILAENPARLYAFPDGAPE
jgi:2-pyrone-4,6-dicarboxylate lactonase